MFKLANCAKVIPLWTVFFFSSYTYIARLSGSSIKTLHLQGRNSWWCHCVFWHRAQSLTVSIKRSIRRCRCRTQVLGGYFCMYRNWWWHVLQVNSKTPSWSRGRQKTLAQHGVICSKGAKNSFLTPKRWSDYSLDQPSVVSCQWAHGLCSSFEIPTLLLSMALAG